MPGWLKRLTKRRRKITEVNLELGRFEGYNIYCVQITDAAATFSINIPNYGDTGTTTYKKEDIESVCRALDAIGFETWKKEYLQKGEARICDGEQWELSVCYDNGKILKSGGDNTYPENWNDLLDFFGIDYDDEEELSRTPGDIIYCSVSLGDWGKTYYYTTDDETIRVGDEVIVPVGSDYNELTGTVEKIEYFQPDDVPFPIDKTKKIIGKEYDDDDYEPDEDMPDSEVLWDVDKNELNLSADDTEVIFSVNGLGNGAEHGDINSCWCLVTLRVKNQYFNFEKSNDELFDFREMVHIRNTLRALIDWQSEKTKYIELTEPDISFRISPHDSALIINLPDCNGQSYTIPLYPHDVRHLKFYLDYQIHKLRKEWNGMDDCLKRD